MKARPLLILLFTAAGLSLALSACGGTSAPSEVAAGPGSLTREDAQGPVTIKVTPLNLDSPSSTIDFEVILDTHSVDLSLDLTKLALLRTDRGAEVQASAWPVGSGHHYNATLSFPNRTGDGKSLLEGATKLILVIKNVGVPERIYEWSLLR